MADFCQTGVITALHRLGDSNIEQLEGEIRKYSKLFPIALLLPSLYSELEGEALRHIVEELKGINYLNEIIITLGVASEKEFEEAKRFFSVLSQDVRVIWNDGPKIQELLQLLVKNDVEIGMAGKGRSAWMGYGYILAREKSKIIALHDCDVLTYNREFLARLCYPVINPNLGYEFCKGYYSRVTDRLHGRVTRLLVTPLIRSLQKLLGYHPMLVYLDSFRYPLAGEFSMIADLARINKIPGDWGLEIGVLSEIYRNCALNRICQADLCDAYEHKHQDLSPDDPKKGLLKMCVDISKSLFRNLVTEGIIFNDGFFKTLRATYQRSAQEAIKKYEDDADINTLYFDRHAERVAVEAFIKGIKMASDEFLEDPFGIPLISSWSRAASAIPDIFQKIKSAVDEDNKF
ncbi:MAG: glycosyl transferase [Nitrospirota bacterium]